MRWLFLFIAPLLWANEPEKRVHFKVASHCKLPVDLVIQTPRDIATDSKGNIYMLDAGAKTVLAWDEMGSFLRSFGSEGQGPGELSLSDGFGAVAINENYVVVVDDLARKIHFWDREFNFKKTIPKPAGFERLLTLEAYGDQFVIVTPSAKLGNQRLVLVDNEFGIVDVLATVDDHYYRPNDQGHWDYRPLADLIVVGFGPKDIWYSNSGHNWIRKIDLSGRVKDEFRVPFVAEDFDPKEKTRFIEGFNKWRGAKDTITFPDKNTVIDFALPLEKNLIAVSQYRAVNGRFTGLVLDKDTGDICGKFSYLLGDQMGFFASVRGKLVSVTGDDNDDYRLDILELIMEDANENEDKP